MRRKLTCLIAAAALSVCGMPAWAQSPIQMVMGLPASSPPPAAAAVAGPGCAPMHDDDCCATGYFTGGMGIYFITPFFSNNATGVVSVAGNKTGGENFAVSNYSQHMNVAPQFWLGYTWDNGWGVRGRYFEFIGDTSSSVTGTPTSDIFSDPLEAGLGTGQKFISTRSLHVDVIDLEATNNFVWGRWAMLMSVGVRYAHVASALTSTNLDTDGTVLNNVAGSSSFSGFGPTIALEARRRIADSDFFLYGSGRASILCGTLNQNFSNSYVPDGDDVHTAQAAALQTDNITSRSVTVMGIGEIELGAEWARVVGRFRLFAQAAFVGQIWVGGFPTSNPGFLIEDEVGTGIFGNNSGNFGFLGGVLRAGVNF